MSALRPYQIDAVSAFNREVEAGRRRVLMVAPTGSGKTIIGCEVIRQTLAARADVLVLAHRREIIAQTSQKLFAGRIVHGIIQARFTPRPLERVQVASIQTLHRRAIQSEAINLPQAGLVWIDEAHHCPARSYRDIIDKFPNAILLGTTATPCRGDGRGLGGIFDCIVETPQVPDLIKLQFLVPTKVYAPTDPDLRGVRSRLGDYVEAELADRMDRPKLVGDIVSHWHKFGGRRRTVCFAVSVEHSIHIRDEFVSNGVRTEHIDGATPKPERDAALARLASGEIELVTNCMVLTEGWDMPEVGCCILARPTKKIGLYRQMIGRVLRPAEGKREAIILDHSGAVFRHGFVEDPVEWTLDPDRRAISPTHQARVGNGAASRLIECTNCGAVRVTGEPCPHCGFLPQRPPRGLTFDDGDLGLVDRIRRVVTTDVNDPSVRARWHAMLAHIAEEHGYKPGWVAHKYREKFGVWPAWGDQPDPLPPSLEVRSWVRSRQIAFAKRSA